MPRGWYSDRMKHSLASKGIRTKTRQGNFNSNGIEKNIEYSTHQEALYDLSDRELSEIFMRLRNGEAIIIDDTWKTRALLWKNDFGDFNMEVIRKIADSYDEIYMRYDLDINERDFITQVDLLYYDLEVNLEVVEDFPETPSKLKEILRTSQSDIYDKYIESDSVLYQKFVGNNRNLKSYGIKEKEISEEDVRVARMQSIRTRNVYNKSEKGSITEMRAFKQMKDAQENWFEKEKIYKKGLDNKKEE